MRKQAVIVAVLAVVVVGGAIGWQVGSCYVANSELQSDMRDLAVQTRFRVGMAPLPSEDQLRDSVVESAKAHGIDLDPQQVSVQSSMDDDSVLSISLAADYEARVNLVVYSFDLHFTPSSSHTGQVLGK